MRPEDKYGYHNDAKVVHSVGTSAARSGRREGERAVSPAPVDASTQETCEKKWRVATHNVRTATCKWDEIGARAYSEDVDVLCLQEVRTDKYAQRMAKKVLGQWGYEITFGNERIAKKVQGRRSANVNGLATVYRYGRALKTQGLDGQRALGMVLQYQRGAPLTIVNVHADIRWSDSQYEKWMSALWSNEGSVLALGDWNREPSHASIMQWLLRDIDCTDEMEVWDEATVNESHYDYGLYHSQEPLHILRREQMEGLNSDHD